MAYVDLPLEAEVADMIENTVRRIRKRPNRVSQAEERVVNTQRLQRHTYIYGSVYASAASKRAQE